MASLFDPILVPKAQLNPNFVALLDERCLGTQRALDEAFARFPERNNEFIKGFQAHGFHAGVWELYLSQCLQEAAYSVTRTGRRPDFRAEREGRVVFVEATTTNPTLGKGPGPDLRRVLSEGPPTEGEREEHRQDYLQRLAGVLERKLDKNYPALDWVAGHPVVLAVSPFHDAYSLLRADTWALQYVYGIEPVEQKLDDGRIERALRKIGTREVAGRPLQFGLFDRENARGISAIIFSNSGTIAKFNRYAAFVGLHPPCIKAVLRMGACFDPDPAAFVPRQFAYEVGKTGPDETWAQGLNVMHNPNAIYPLDDLFVGVMEHRVDADGQLGHSMPYFHPYWSVTQLLSASGKPEAERGR